MSFVAESVVAKKHPLPIECVPVAGSLTCLPHLSLLLIPLTYSFPEVLLLETPCNCVFDSDLRWERGWVHGQKNQHQNQISLLLLALLAVVIVGLGNMSRLSFRPRPLDIHKKLPIVKTLKEFEDDEVVTGTTTRNSYIARLSLEADNEAQQAPARKVASEIPIPQFVVVDTYEQDYTCTFTQPTSYVHARGARSEVGEFVEYDLDNEDEDWLEEFNKETKILSPERLESLLFKLEILDHKTRERAGVITPLGSPVPVLLQLDAAAEALESQNTSYGVIQSLYNYWKAKRDRWQKPILRRLQPPPPVNDTNPYNVFRPREKAHRHHTRRMQRRENNLQSFEKLCQVRRNFNQAKALLEALIKREEKKREVMECEVNLQRIQIKYRHQSQLFEDGLALSGFPSFSHRKESSEDYSKNFPNGYTPNRNAVVRKSHGADSMQMIGRTKREPRRPLLRGCFQRVDPHEPVLLFAKPIDQEKLAAAGIKKPSEPPNVNGETIPRYRLQGRIGRGGRIIFDRLNPISRNPVIDEMSLLPAPCPQHPPPG